MIGFKPEELKTLSAKTIKELCRDIAPSDYQAVSLILEEDERAAVKAIAKSLKGKHKKYAQALQKLEDLKMLENSYHSEGYQNIAGSDEVGRGPLAGPVVCAAVIMPPASKILYVDDSKKLSAKLREELNEKILGEAIAVEIGLRTPEEIDTINILEATKSAMAEAVSRLKPQPNLLLIDALTIDTPVPVKGIIHGDAICYTIAAASIVAKVYRDTLMQAYHEKYPQYGFDRNMGYGTAEHIAAIKEYGLTPIHRRSFVKKFVDH